MVTVKQLATACGLAMSGIGCAESPMNAGLPPPPPLYTYNALTCAQLQREAVLVSIAALEVTGSPVGPIPRADPSALLVVPWPSPTGTASPRGAQLAAQMEALERTSRAKSCAIRFQRSGGSAR